MIIDLIRFFIYLFFTITAGSAVLGLFPLKKLKPPFYIKLSWAYLLGVGAVTWWMFVLSNFTSFGLLKIIIPWLVILGYKFYKNHNAYTSSEFSIQPLCNLLKANYRKFDFSLKVSKFIGLGHWDKLFILLICLQLVFITYQALSRESLAFDALNNWIFKAKVFFMEKRVEPEFFTNEIHLTNGILAGHSRRELHYLQDYPLLVPLNVSFLFLILGRVDLIILKLIWVLFYTILIVNFNYFLKFFAARLSIFFTFLLTTIPYFYEEVVGKYAPYADLALSEFIFIGVMLFMLARRMNNGCLLSLGLLFISFAGWTKNEGLIPLLMAVFIFWKMAYQLKISQKYLAIAAVVNLPWWFYMKFYDIKSTTFFLDKFNSFGEFLYKLLFTGWVFILQLFDLALFNLLWIIFFALVFLNWRRVFRNPPLLPIGFIFFELLILYGFHIITINEPYNFQRLVFVFTPLTLFSIAIWTDRILLDRPTSLSS